MLVTVIGGTGTGKSTLVNRLLGTGASATSFRRTFTTGAVAIAREPAADVPPQWLGVEHIVVDADALPARGRGGSLIIVPRALLGERVPHEALLDNVVLIDTPDLDGDQPAHHAEADRAFRWAEAVVFLVTPEKYQMTELLPYYRLAARYAIPTRFVMNKCEEQAVVEDYRGQLEGAGESGRAGERASGGEGTRLPVYAIARDDSAYQPPATESLDALREAVSVLSPQSSVLPSGLGNRAGDLVGRFEDQILAPLRQERREADRLIAALRDMESPQPGVDVNPVTQDLQRRLQQRSVLYLMGPQRVLDRVRQAPALLVRLPRVAWDYVMRGELSAGALNPGDAAAQREVPDFRAILIDQFAVMQSRIDDLLRTSPAAQKWMVPEGANEATCVAPDDAGRIADEEIGELKVWLEKRWNTTPKDTKAVHAMLRHLPGGKKLSALAEAAPYLLTVGLIADHLTGFTVTATVGGFMLLTGLTERLSNEVARQTRATNNRIADRFARLAHDQIERTCAWLDRQAVPTRMIERLDRAAGELASAAGIDDDTGNRQ